MEIPANETDWVCDDGTYMHVEREGVFQVMDYLGELPGLDELVDDLTSLTMDNIISRAGEHGGWFAVNTGSENPDDPVEAGIIVAWRSDRHPVAYSNPCWCAALALGYMHADIPWSFGDIEYPLEVLVPDSLDDTGQIAYGKLCEAVEEVLSGA